MQVIKSISPELLKWVVCDGTEETQPPAELDCFVFNKGEYRVFNSFCRPRPFLKAGEVWAALEEVLS